MKTYKKLAVSLLIALFAFVPFVASANDDDDADDLINSLVSNVNSLSHQRASLNSQLNTYKTLYASLVRERAKTAPSIIIVSPKGGSNINASSSVNIKWRGTNLAGSAINIDLVNAQNPAQIINLATATPNDGVETLDIASRVGFGRFYLRVKATSLDVQAQTKKVITLRDPEGDRSISVSSPRGGFVVAGQGTTTVFSTSNITANSLISIYMVSGDAVLSSTTLPSINTSLTSIRLPSNSVKSGLFSQRVTLPRVNATSTVRLAVSATQTGQPLVVGYSEPFELRGVPQTVAQLKPTITSISPLSPVEAGISLTINGTNFVTATSSTVYFDNVAVQVQATSSNQISVVVPTTLAIGSYNVKVVTANQMTNVIRLQVLKSDALRIESPSETTVWNTGNRYTVRIFDGRANAFDGIVRLALLNPSNQATNIGSFVANSSKTSRRYPVEVAVPVNMLAGNYKLQVSGDSRFSSYATNTAFTIQVAPAMTASCTLQTPARDQVGSVAEWNVNVVGGLVDTSRVYTWTARNYDFGTSATATLRYTIPNPSSLTANITPSVKVVSGQQSVIANCPSVNFSKSIATPRITSISLSQAEPNTTVTVTGTDLVSGSKVVFKKGDVVVREVVAQVNQASTTATFVVPAIEAKAYSVYVTNANGSSNAKTFKVLKTKAIEVTTGATDTAWQTGKTYAIRWKDTRLTNSARSTFISLVPAENTTGLSVINITPTFITNDGSYSYKVPTTALNGQYVLTIEVTQRGVAGATDTFTGESAGIITITNSPQASAELVVYNPPVVAATSSPDAQEDIASSTPDDSVITEVEPAGGTVDVAAESPDGILVTRPFLNQHTYQYLAYNLRLKATIPKELDVTSKTKVDVYFVNVADSSSKYFKTISMKALKQGTYIKILKDVPAATYNMKLVLKNGGQEVYTAYSNQFQLHALEEFTMEDINSPRGSAKRLDESLVYCRTIGGCDSALRKSLYLTPQTFSQRYLDQYLTRDKSYNLKYGGTARFTIIGGAPNQNQEDFPADYKGYKWSIGEYNGCTSWEWRSASSGGVGNGSAPYWKCDGQKERFKVASIVSGCKDGDKFCTVKIDTTKAKEAFKYGYGDFFISATTRLGTTRTPVVINPSSYDKKKGSPNDAKYIYHF